MIEAPLYNEKQLFAQIARDDEKAFQQIFDLYKQRIFQFVLKMVKSEAIAEELVQEIFMKIWINRTTLEQVDNPGNYLFMMARNKTVDHIRKISNDMKMRKDIGRIIEQKQDAAYETILLNESKRLVAEAVAQLSQQKQLIFKLSRTEGLSIQEIADQLNISKSTVKNHIVEILKHIKSHLATHSGIMLIAFIILMSDWV